MSIRNLVSSFLILTATVAHAEVPDCVTAVEQGLTDHAGFECVANGHRMLRVDVLSIEPDS